jgi:uncharacterized protein YndB with AHSA1/START domain
MSKTETAAAVRLEVRIDAPRERVWQALTTDFAAWWPGESFNVGGAAAQMRLEPHLGGRMYEDWGDGQGLMWGQVVGLHRPERLYLVGDSFPEWGGPARSYMTWHLEADGEGTLVRFAESQLGERSPADRADKEKGWTFLVEQRLKAYLEGRPLPAWKD